MSWVNVNRSIPITNSNFQDIVCGLVFNCPSSTDCKVKIGVDDKGKALYKHVYKPVSARAVSFRSRGINKDLLRTILAQIRRPLKNAKTYGLINASESVEQTLNSIMSTIPLGDPYYEVIVLKKRYDMTDLEALYYYIRNAFAHGAFEVISTNSGKVYLLESSKDGSVKARMRLKEATLMEYVRLASLTISDIKALQKPKKKVRRVNERNIYH